MDLHELNHYIIFFEFYEKLMNESTQTIWFSFDYNSHDMLNKLDKFCRNNSRLEIIGCEYYFFYRTWQGNKNKFYFRKNLTSSSR